MLPAATINFVVGLVALVLAAIVAVLVVGPPNPLPSAWYLYLGGPFGAIFIGLGAWVVGRIGVLLLALGAVAGQVVGALVLDARAAVGRRDPGRHDGPRGAAHPGRGGRGRRSVAAAAARRAGAHGRPAIMRS